MTDPPTQAAPLTLPPAIFNARYPQPHPDSEEAIKHERHRVAQELETIRQPGARSGSFNGSSLPQAPHARRSPTAVSHGRQSLLRRRPSETSTAEDSVGPDRHNERRHRLRRQTPRWYDPVVKFWKTQVNVTIDEGTHRDHLALERTFLGYLRTSLALVMTGVVTAQLFRLQRSINPDPDLGYFVVGIPLAAACITSGMVVLFIGAHRFWRQQNAMIRGKVYAGGWEIVCIMVLAILLCAVLFAICVAIDVDKSYV